MAPQRRRAGAVSYRPYAIGMGVFLLASVALASGLLLATRPDQTEQPQPPAPAAAGPTPGEAAAPATTPEPPPQPTLAPLQVDVSVLEPNYTVEPGDTLGAISSRFGTSIEAIRSLNRLEDGELLRIGQQLIVPQEP